MLGNSNNLSQCHNSGIAVTTENVKISETVRSISVSPFHLISFLTVKWQTVWISQIFNFLKGNFARIFIKQKFMWKIKQLTELASLCKFGEI